MNLPSYFLADLPPEAELSAGLIAEACQTLKRNGQQFLEGRTTESIVRILDRLGRHYGFTAEELVFVLNYDIKYRLGRNAETEGE